MIFTQFQGFLMKDDKFFAFLYFSVTVKPRILIYLKSKFMTKFVTRKLISFLVITRTKECSFHNKSK
jgi:hypothetical protein